MNRRGKPEWWHKEKAIRDSANMLRTAICAHDREWLESATLIPVPPSKARGHPEYDDRICQVLRLMGSQLDIRELIIQRESMAACHVSKDRPTPQQLMANYEVDEELVEPTPDHVIVVDDLLVAGSHFKAIQWLLQPRYNDVPICGLFIARRFLEEIP